MLNFAVSHTSQDMIENLSVVFPMFNERGYINRAIEGILPALEEITDDYEIIIVDDASRDGSSEIADELSKKIPQLKVIHHKKNRKLGGSLKTGFNAASKRYVLYSDIDMPFDFKEIKHAVAVLLEQNADLVSAYRLNRMNEGIRRCAYSIAYNLFVRFLFGIDVKDVNFSFKLIRKDLLAKLDLFSEGSFIDAEMLVRAKRRGVKIVQFGTRYFPRLNGSSRLMSFGVILKVLQEAFIFRLGLCTARDKKKDAG